MLGFFRSLRALAGVRGQWMKLVSVSEEACIRITTQTMSPCLYLAATLSGRPCWNWLSICYSQLKPESQNNPALIQVRLHYCLKYARIQVHVAIIFLDLCDTFIVMWHRLICAGVSCRHTEIPCKVNIPITPNGQLWPSAMMKQQATQESKREIASWWQSSIHPPYKLNWEKTLVKDPDFIGLELSHLIKLSVME